MNKLTLEHISPYLPYGLKVKYKGITNLKDLAEHNKKEPIGDFNNILFNSEYHDWLESRPDEIIGDRVSEIKRVHFYKNGIRIYVGKRHGYLKLVWLDDIKPILRPLSDLNDSDLMKAWSKEHNIKFTILGLSLNLRGAEQIDITGFPLQFLKDLFKNHYDVFGLIDKGLAVDINTVESIDKT